MYTKIIRSGTLLERWEYQIAPDFERLSEPKEKKKRSRAIERRDDNIKACRQAFFRLVRANLFEERPPILLTLTYRENKTDIAEAYEDFTRFGKRMRTAYGSGIAWVAVPEFQKRGAVHFHVLVFNIDNGIVEAERRTRAIANIWGNGFVDAIKTDGNAKLSTYLAKYMQKAMHDPRLLGKRAYSASRNVLRPVHLNTPFQISHAYQEWDLVEGEGLVKAREYDTLFLGRCLYKQFVLMSNLHESSANKSP